MLICGIHINPNIEDEDIRIDLINQVTYFLPHLLAHLSTLRARNQRWRLNPHILIGENRWRAQRYGVEDTLLDLGCTTLTPMSVLIEGLIKIVGEEAERLGCLPELLYLREIARRGTPLPASAAFTAMRGRRANPSRTPYVQSHETL